MMQHSGTATAPGRHMPQAGIALPRESEYAGVTRERRQPLEFFSFDRDYVQRLVDGEGETERHFVSYFSSLLVVKLRHRLRSREEIEDVRQEVFLRVLRSIRKGPGLQRPECLGAYVNSVCNNVVLEYFRDKSRAGQWDDQAPEPCDPGAGIERELMAEESRRHVRTLIDEMPPKDRSLIRAVFLDERDKDAVCREQGVGRDYLRVLLHRAKKRLRHLLAQAQTPAVRSVTDLTDLSQP
jgi:RNA polymerase sigma-70 factor, ECF subfamily